MPEYAGMSLREELKARFADAERRRQEEEMLSRGWQPPARWQRVGQSLKHDLEDIGYGMKKALSGATLGASDWALRKLGITDDDYLSEREAEGLGNAVKGAGFVSELGGNMLGAGGAIVKGLSKTGLKGLKLAGTSGGLEGAAYGLTGSDSWSDVPQNVAIGAGFGAALPVSLYGAGYVGRKLATPFSSRLMTAGMKGGLDNVSSNPYAVKILKQGLRNNDDVAQKYLERVLPATRNINRETAGMVDNALTSRINVPETIAAERARYGDYIAKHGADEVLDFAMHNQIPNSKIFGNVAPDTTPVNMLNITETTPNFGKTAELRNWLYDKFGDAKKVSISSTNETADFSKSGARRVLKRARDNNNNAYYPQIEDIVKNGLPSGTRLADADHIKSVTGQNIYHTGIIHNGKPYSFEFYVDQPNGIGNRNFAGNKIKEIQGKDIDVGFSDHTDTPTPANFTLADLRENVNSDLPNVSTLYEGLTPFQSGQLDRAIKTGISKTNAKAGSLESLSKVKQEINEAISKAQSTDKPSEVWQLQELKGRFDNAMPQGLKDVDAGFARAKRLEEAFERGTHYNPNNVSGADMIAGLSADEQNAFTQGMFKRMTNNSLSGKSLADDALKYENTLSQVLPETIYNPLMQNLNRQSTRFGRLSELGRAAENRLRSPEGARFFGREQFESRGSLIGSGLDRANNLLRGRAVRNASNNLMNPEFVGLPVESWVVRNPNLSAALSAEMANNYNNR